MKVDVYRKVETSEAITGEFWLDGIKECYYLEPSRDTPFYPGHPCIEARTYRVILTMSPHLGYICPEVLNVPGRTAIRWHIGNGLHGHVDRTRGVQHHQSQFSVAP